MTRSTGIGWAEESWNPTTGCTKISPGCAHCWAERMARRLQGMGQERYARGFDVTTHEDLLEKPLHWAKPRLVYVSFMGDLFHLLPCQFIARQSRQGAAQRLEVRSELQFCLHGSTRTRVWIHVPSDWPPTGQPLRVPSDEDEGVARRPISYANVKAGRLTAQTLEAVSVDLHERVLASSFV